MVTISVSDIQEVYGEKEPSLNTTKKTALKDVAESITDNNFGGRVSRKAEIEGDETVFAKYLGAHFWELAEGGEVQSSSQTGGSVSYQHLQSNLENSLGETRFGRVCLMMVRQGASTGIVRSYF